MQQLTLARQAEFQRYTKKTRREQFLDEMEAVMPWVELQALVEPYYSKGETGRKPVGLGIMLRVYFLQQWFALSDPGVEDALYESSVLRRFTGVDLGRAPAPDETTILNFRHLLEEHDLCGQMLDAVNHYLESRGIRITIEILGIPVLHARVRANAEVAKLVVRLTELTPEGKSWLISYGLLNLTHRSSDEHPSPLEPGKDYDVEVPLYFAAHRFRAGIRFAWRFRRIYGRYCGRRPRR